MKTFTLPTLLCLMLLVAGFGVQSLSAQSIEGLPEFAFTEYDPDFNLEEDCPDETKSFPMSLQGVSTPSILAAPNPTGPEGWVRIWYNQLVGASQLMILNASGQLVHRTTVGTERMNRGVYNLPSSGFVPGVYFVLLKSGAYEAIEKIVIN